MPCRQRAGDLPRKLGVEAGVDGAEPRGGRCGYGLFVGVVVHGIVIFYHNVRSTASFTAEKVLKKVKMRTTPPPAFSELF